MKTGMTIEEFASELQRQQAAKQDYLADTRNLEFRPSDEGGVRLHGLPDGDLGVRPTAHGQFANRLGVPKKYYDLMNTDAPDLLADNLNHWLDKEPAKRLVRTMDGNVRAFLSDRYRTLDNAEYAEAILPVVQDLGATIASAQITESKMYIKVTQPGMEEILMHPGAEMGVGHDTFDRVIAAAIFGNSEIGMGSIYFDPAAHTNGCTNLAVIRDVAVRRTHLGSSLGGDDGVTRYLTDETRRQSDRALFAQMGDLARASLDGRIFKEFVDNLRLARGEEIEGNPVTVVEKISKRFQLTEDEQGSVLEHLVKGGDLTQYGLHSAVTRAAQDVESYDRSTEMEYLGADIISLPKSDWKTVASDN